MILVDTSVWIDHLRAGDAELADHLLHGRIVMHPMIMGELACGNLQNRNKLLSLWGHLPQAKQATHQEVMYCIEQNHFMGRGIGYVDACLLSSTLLMSDTLLWTRDKRLNKLATELHLAHQPTT